MWDTPLTECPTFFIATYHQQSMTVAWIAYGIYTIAE